ncbi:hypothetical protein Ami103574_08280 [Aminipila butyrica]|uniref:Uncharacterized protein n=1 Tax=Aminipila butyrica TaxID=433296 RepID=A0A858BWP1_9FIRM|nr:hypothetical protein [Aminipila butyrica]QIB69320.1 hypothetical protein Ami103574_08280 [Aminipila butyrica]
MFRGNFESDGYQYDPSVQEEREDFLREIMIQLVESGMTGKEIAEMTQFTEEEVIEVFDSKAWN